MRFTEEEVFFCWAQAPPVEAEVNQGKSVIICWPETRILKRSRLRADETGSVPSPKKMRTENQQDLVPSNTSSRAQGPRAQQSPHLSHQSSAFGKKMTTTPMTNRE
jgi:hypothetical protein